jgi:DNA-binding CsgD family transcriptional regulator
MMSQKISPNLKNKIREEVKAGKSKLQVSIDLGISYKKIRECTKDIKSISGGISNSLRKKIREEVRNGKTKRQVAIQYQITDRTVYYHTRDICSYPLRKMRVQDKKLELMKDLIRDGYALSSSRYSTNEYNKLKKYFPSICKAKMYNRVIFYLKNKKDAAARAFIEKSERKIISYQELKQVTRVFDANLDIKEKRRVISKNRSEKLFKNKEENSNSLLKEDGSLAFFHIRAY